MIWHAKSFNWNSPPNMIKIAKGVRQGDTISPKLFTATPESIFRKIDWEEKGMNIDGENLINLRFAYDTSNTSENAEEWQQMRTDLNRESIDYALRWTRQKLK